MWISPGANIFTSNPLLPNIMTSDQSDNNLWETSKLFRLVPSEYKFLYGDEMTYSQAQSEENIEKKVTRIPNRIDSLRIDMETLFDEGYLEGEPWRSRMVGLFRRIGNSSDEELTTALLNTSATDLPTDSPASHFGYKLGDIADHLISGIEELDNRHVRQHIVWGFMKRVYLPGPHSSDHEEYNTAMDELVAFIDRAHTARYERAQESMQEIETRRAFARELLAHILESFEDDRIDLPEVTSIPKDETERLVAELVLGAYIEATVGNQGTLEEQWDQFLMEIDRSSFDISSEFTVETVHSYLHDYGILTFLEQIDTVVGDAGRILDASWKRVEMESVLRAIANNPDDSSAEIRQSVDGSHVSAITRLAKDMAGDEKTLGDDERKWGTVFSDRPLVTGDSDGWRLTEHGKHVYWCLCDSPPSVVDYKHVDVGRENATSS